MPINNKFLAEFQHDEIYHVYNRTNNKEALFLNDEHRLYFLRRFNELVSPFADTYCRCLLPNHFHFLIKVKSHEQIMSHLTKMGTRGSLTEKRYCGDPALISSLMESCFKRFFQSYAQAFNKQLGRSGNLFCRPFKRILVENNDQFTQNVIYIHTNSEKHGVAGDFTKYRWSSWQGILSNGKTNLLRDYLLNWFGGRDTFIKAHLNKGCQLFEVLNEGWYFPES